MLVILVQEIQDHSAYIELIEVLSSFQSECLITEMDPGCEPQAMMITPVADKTESEQLAILEEVASTLRKTEYPFQLFEEQY